MDFCSRPRPWASSSFVSIADASRATVGAVNGTRLHNLYGPTEATVDVELTTPPFLGFIAREAERRIQAELPASMERFRALMDAEPG